MRVLILNGSPRRKGTVATLLRAVAEGAAARHEVEWIDVYDLRMQPCVACMKCRGSGRCALPADDAHVVGRKIREADALVVGTPTHWGNMSALLKLLLDRNATVFIDETGGGRPKPRQKGKRAVIVTACTTPWPFNLLAASRRAVGAVREVLGWGGYKLVGKVVKPGTRMKPEISLRLLEKAKRLGRRL
jgi:NAD(P)H-dependent FMN reductase